MSTAIFPLQTQPPPAPNACCVAHLVRTHRGVMSHGVFFINPNHCKDGERARCTTCKRTWVHTCNEATGCSWDCVTKTVVAPRTPHHCHAFLCTVHVAPRFLMCNRHWRMVPAVVQKAVWRHYRIGQEIDKIVTPEYMAVQRVAVWTVAVLEGHYQIGDVPRVGSDEYMDGPAVR